MTDSFRVKVKWISCSAASTLFAKHVLIYLVSLIFRSIQEICLGIMGNLACHESLVDAICLEKGLISTVVDQLFLEDVKCVSETFRLDMFETTSILFAGPEHP